MRFDEVGVGTFDFHAAFRNSVKLLARNGRIAVQLYTALQVHWPFSMGEANGSS